MTQRWDNPFLQDRLNHLADYRPEWDVQSLHALAATKIVEAIRRSTAGQGPRSEQKIQVLLGPPGCGKTHLLGRVRHILGN
jgi:chromosomal replication initiation ATPase DnaA